MDVRRALAAATLLALQSNTALAVLDRQVAEARARAALARAQRIPDPTIEGTVTHGAEPDFTCLSARLADWVWAGWLGVTRVGAQGWFVCSRD